MIRSRTQKRAHLREVAADQVLRAAEPLWQQAGAMIRAGATKALRRGRDPDRMTKIGIDAIREGVLDVNVAADLRGRLHVYMMAARNKAARKLRAAAGNPVEDALDFITSRLNLTESQLGAVRDTYGANATDVSEVFQRSVNDRLGEAIRESTKLGEHVRDGMTRLRSTFDAIGIGDVRDFELENIFRTQTQLAFGAGEWQAYQDPAVDEILWGYEYATVGDDRVREEHEALDGTRLPKDDPMWDEIWPPNGFNCRCAVLPIFDNEVELQERVDPAPIEIDGRKVEPVPDEGWDFNPGEVFKTLMNPVRMSLIPDRLKGGDRVLAGLYRLGGEARQVDIAQVIGRGRANVNARLDSIIRAGLVDEVNAEFPSYLLTTKGIARARSLVRADR